MACPMDAEARFSHGVGPEPRWWMGDSQTPGGTPAPPSPGESGLLTPSQSPVLRPAEGALSRQVHSPGGNQ